MKQLSEYLAAQKKAGTPKIEYARRFGINPTYLSQILSGQKRPSYELMCRIADETGIPLEAWRIEEPDADNV